MAFRMKRTSAYDDRKPEPMRKKQKILRTFDKDSIKNDARLAEISIDKSLTADEKRIESAKRVLASLQDIDGDKLNMELNDEMKEILKENEDNIDEFEYDKDEKAIIHQKLMDKVFQQEGKYHFKLANKLRKHLNILKTKSKTKSEIIDESSYIQVKSLHGHRLSVTCMAMGYDRINKEEYIVTGSKDGSIIKWDLKTGKQLQKIWHAWPRRKNKQYINKKEKKFLRPKPVLAIGISPDQKYLVSGGEDALIRVWSIKHRQNKKIKTKEKENNKENESSKLEKNEKNEKNEENKENSANTTKDNKNNNNKNKNIKKRRKFHHNNSGCYFVYHSTLRGHESAVTGIAFALNPKLYEASKGSLNDISNNEKISLLKEENGITLFTTGKDRQIRVYDMTDIGFAEPLYGHTLEINNIDTTTDDRCITVGNDGTVRYWRLKQQSQLIFYNGHNGMIDTCCMITSGRFITGSEDGSIAMWNTTKKYPMFKIENAHTTIDNNHLIYENENEIINTNLKKNKIYNKNEIENWQQGIELKKINDNDDNDNNNNNNNISSDNITKPIEKKHWITCVACRPQSDVFASGGSDGIIRLWGIGKSTFHHIQSIRIPKGGFINAIKWNDNGNLIIAGIGNEHRLGRWDKVNGARNGICIIKLPFGVTNDDNDDDDDDNDNDSIDGIETKLENDPIFNIDNDNENDNDNSRDKIKTQSKEKVKEKKEKQLDNKALAFLDDEDEDSDDSDDSDDNSNDNDMEDDDILNIENNKMNIENNNNNENKNKQKNRKMNFDIAETWDRWSEKESGKDLLKQRQNAIENVAKNYRSENESTINEKLEKQILKEKSKYKNKELMKRKQGKDSFEDKLKENKEIASLHEDEWSSFFGNVFGQQ